MLGVHDSFITWFLGRLLNVLASWDIIFNVPKSYFGTIYPFKKKVSYCTIISDIKISFESIFKFGLITFVLSTLTSR